MIRKFTLAAMLAVSVVGAAVVATTPVLAADEPAAKTFDQQVADLLTANPAGGQALQDALAALISGQSDPAAAAAAAMLAFGSATQEQLSALGAAINGVDAITPEKLEAAISDAVEKSADPVAASRAMLASAAFLSGDNQGAIGRGLATAAADIGVLNPTAAASMKSIVEASNIDGVKTAYSQQETTIGSVNQNGGGDNLSNKNNEQNGNTQESDTPPVSPH
jgi:hypothetical protein